MSRMLPPVRDGLQRQQKITNEGKRDRYHILSGTIKGNICPSFWGQKTRIVSKRWLFHMKLRASSNRVTYIMRSASQPVTTEPWLF